MSNVRWPAREGSEVNRHVMALHRGPSRTVCSVARRRSLLLDMTATRDHTSGKAIGRYEKQTEPKVEPIRP